jgi:4-hydroxy-2-oxoheptanedioate aldolase
VPNVVVVLDDRSVLEDDNVRSRWMIAMCGVSLLGTLGVSQGQRRLNPLIELLAAKKPVFGLYAPSNRRPRGGASATDQAPKSVAQLAKDAMAQPASDYVFDGGMEHDFDGGYPAFVEFAKGMAEGGALWKSPFPRLHHPLVVKTPEIAPDPARARERISRQLNLGVSAIVFVGVESADEVKQGLAMMRFKSNGGTRPDEVGMAPQFWGMSEKEYKTKADVWPLNPDGELLNWTIVETREGLARVREIAAVRGIGVLFPGAGTLRGVFTTEVNGQRTFDEKGWEAAIQRVLAACKEFNVPCGYPANLGDIELRMQQGFSVFVVGWGESGFKTIELGRKLAGRPETNTMER